MNEWYVDRSDNVLDPREAPEDEEPDEPEVPVGDVLDSLYGGASPACGCSQSAGDQPQLSWLLLLLAALGSGRRRRKA